MLRLSSYLVVLGSFCVGLSYCSPVTPLTEDGGYSIIVAIGRNVVEAPELLDTLKGLFTSASAFLYNATRNQVFFEEVTLALPSTWTHDPQYGITIRDQFQEAHFRVDTPHELYDDEPYTDHPEGCGRPGRFIHLTPNYLSHLNEPPIVQEFGFSDRRIVKEWAKFRYGVFEEHFNEKLQHPSGKPFYRHKGELLPTTCTEDVSRKGMNLDPKKGEICQPKDEDSKDCVFQPSEEYITSPASIMYSTSIHSMDSFCDDTPERKHNHLAPNLHNIMCKYRSTWDVISSHTDFKLIKPPKNVETAPRFRIVRSAGGNGKSVLLLDISGSMKGEPIERLHETASFVVTHKAAEGSFLGIVAFGTRSHVNQPLTQVTSATRSVLQAKLPKNADGGGTGIGRGLLTALAVLKGPQGTDSPEGGVIVLITDGEETENPTIDDILPSLVTSRVMVHVIAYGEEASVKMEHLSQSTGGRLTLYSNIHDNKADNVKLISNLAEAITVQADVELQPVQVSSATVELVESVSSILLVLDEELGRNTEFTFSSSDLTNVAVELLTPSKKLVTWQSPEYRTENNKMISLNFKEAETGTYNATIRLSADINLAMSISLESEPKDPKKQPIRVQTWIQGSEVVFPNMPQIFAQVKKGDSPVIKANVTADILGPDSKTTIQLRDDGLFPDTLPDDGVYSGSTAGLNGNHRYQVVSYVRNSRGTRLLKRRKKTFHIGRRRRRFIDEEIEEGEEDEDPDYDLEPVSDFERVAEAGVFRVQGWSPDLGDVQAPAPVSDLRVVRVKGNTVTLRWTSPGDDLTSGNASWLDLRGSPHFTQVLTNFDNLLKFNDSLVINGTLTPEPAGEPQTIVLFIPEDFRELDVTNNQSALPDLSDTLYIAVRALDEVNNTGELSNIVNAVFLEDVPESTSTVSTSTTVLEAAPTIKLQSDFEAEQPDEEIAKEVRKDNKSVMIIGIVLIVLFFVAVMFALGYYIRKKRGRYSPVAVIDMFQNR